MMRSAAADNQLARRAHECLRCRSVALAPPDTFRAEAEPEAPRPRNAPLRPLFRTVCSRQEPCFSAHDRETGLPRRRSRSWRRLVAGCATGVQSLGESSGLAHSDKSDCPRYAVQERAFELAGGIGGRPSSQSWLDARDKHASRMRKSCPWSSAERANLARRSHARALRRNTCAFDERDRGMHAPSIAGGSARISLLSRPESAHGRSR